VVFVVEKLALEQVFSGYFGFPSQFSFYSSVLIYSIIDVIFSILSASLMGKACSTNGWRSENVYRILVGTPKGKRSL
jgi:hypothetical protein